jgi:hypothetical protein
MPSFQTRSMRGKAPRYAVTFERPGRSGFSYIWAVLNRPRCQFGLADVVCRFARDVVTPLAGFAVFVAN